MRRPDRPSAEGIRHYTRGMEYYCRRLHRQAVAELARLRTRNDPTEKMGRYYEGMSLRALGLEAMSKGDFQAAEAHFRSAIERIGPSADLADYLAAIYACAHRFDRCARQAERAAELRKDDPATAGRLAAAQWQEGRKTEAIMTLRAAIRRFRQDGNLRVQMGLFQAAEGDLAAAQKSFRQAVQADCSNAEAHYYLALASQARQDVVEAARELQRALELRPADLTLAYQLAKTARAAGEQGARLVLRPAEMRPAGGSSQLDQLARYVAAEGDFVEAFLALPESPIDGELFGLLNSVLEAATGEHPGYADLQFHRSRICRRLGRTEEAIDHARAAVAINPRYIKARIHLADLLAETGQTQGAVDQLRQAVSAGADWADVHCRIGKLLLAGGEPSGARRHLERAVQLNAGYAQAARALALLAA